MLIGLLGVAVDGAIEVSSSMEEIRRANPNMSSWQLASSGMNVGTDILGTMVNTLVFAYIGVRLLLLMAVASPDLQLFKSPLVELLSVGMMSSEILRILAGTFGLVLTGISLEVALVISMITKMFNAMARYAEGLKGTTKGTKDLFRCLMPLMRPKLIHEFNVCKFNKQLSENIRNFP